MILCQSILINTYQSCYSYFVEHKNNDKVSKRNQVIEFLRVARVSILSREICITQKLCADFQTENIDVTVWHIFRQVIPLKHVPFENKCSFRRS